MNSTTIKDCKVIQLNTIHNRAGNITIVEKQNEIPFNINRIYYLYDLPGGTTRGGHAHKELYQLIVAASGSFNVLLDDCISKKIVSLNRPDFGLLIVPGIWRELFEISSGAICLVLASCKYEESDYIRDYEGFKKAKNIL